MKKKAKAMWNKILYRILLTMRRMLLTWNLFVLLLSYLAVTIPESEWSSVKPRWEMKHGRKLSGQTV